VLPRSRYRDKAKQTTRATLFDLSTSTSTSSSLPLLPPHPPLPTHTYRATPCSKRTTATPQSKHHTHTASPTINKPSSISSTTPQSKHHTHTASPTINKPSSISSTILQSKHRTQQRAQPSASQVRFHRSLNVEFSRCPHSPFPNSRSLPPAPPHR